MRRSLWVAWALLTMKSGMLCGVNDGGRFARNHFRFEDHVLVDLEPSCYVMEQVDPAGSSSTNHTAGNVTDSLVAVELVDSDLEEIDFLDTDVVLLGLFGQVYSADDLPIAAITVEVFADIDQDGLVITAPIGNP